MKPQWLTLIYLPLLMIMLPFIFLYERFARNKDEMVEQKFKIRRIFFKAGMIFGMIVTFPLMCLGPLGRPIAILCNAPFYIIGIAYDAFLFRPIFSDIVPYLFNRWNQRIYNKLCLEEGGIRVLELAPGLVSDAISIRLLCVPLEIAKYEALSYSWGGHLVLRRIISANGRAFLVTESVLTALRELRHRSEPRLLWIDAICINQESSADKDNQLEKMGAIYKKAQRVVVWLGKAPVYFDSAVRIMQQIAATPSEETQIIISADKSWENPVKELISRRWWSRVWVVQEVALNQNVTVRVGKHQVPWQTLSNFLRQTKELSQTQLDKKVVEFVQAVSDLQSGRPDPDNGLLGLAVEFRARVATKPLDKLYGLRGLLRPESPRSVKVKTARPVEEVFIRFASKNMIKEQSLAVMALAESSHVTDRSWAVDWQKMTELDWSQAGPMDTFGHSGKRTRYSHFWIGGLSPSIIEQSCVYSAAGPLSHPCRDGTAARSLLNKVDRAEAPIKKIKKGEANPENLYLISLMGWVADTVTDVGMPCEINGFVSPDEVWKDWMKLAGGPWSVTTPTSASFFRCLLGDAWLRSSPPIPFDQVMDTLRDQGNGFQNITIQLLLNAMQEPSKRDICSACVSDRRFIKTAKGRFGLAPLRCRRGDLVCILLGSPVPFILRRSIRKSYECIGQAYIDGIMDYKGSIEDDIRDEKIKLQDFTVR